jgi:pimeloyl-ACP methyl ester carboxylesterase
MTCRFWPVRCCASASPAAAGRPKPKPLAAVVKKDPGLVAFTYCFNMRVFDAVSATMIAFSCLTCASVENKKSGVIGVVAFGTRSVQFSPFDTLTPAWLTEQDLDYYTQQFEQAGFRGALNWYRAIQLNWELMGAWTDAVILTPALYIMGERDVVVHFPGYSQVIAIMRRAVPQLKEMILLPGCGHWTQEERPQELNSALIDFLKGLPTDS